MRHAEPVSISVSTVNDKMDSFSTQRDELSPVNWWIGKSREWTESFLDQLDSMPVVKCVVLLGSTIRQRIHQRSDFDLLIVYEGDHRPRFNAPIEVDVRRYSVRELDRKLKERDEILCWALKYGVVVFDPDGVWQRLAAKVGDNVPLPSLSDADSRGRRSLERAVEMLKSRDEDAADDLVLAALTQIARRNLIAAGIFPASRPELPAQLRKLMPNNPVADALEKAMFGNASPAELVANAKLLIES